MSSLRNYQEDIISRARAHMAAGVKSMVIVSPTGSGKTLLTAHMVKTAASKGMGSWFICHRRELIAQSMGAFADEGVSFGIIANGYQPDHQKIVQIAGIQTLINRYQQYKKPALIIVDEFHHAASKSWAQLISNFKDSYIVGLTATPIRLDGKGLRDFAQQIVLGPSVQSLIENKYLSKYKLFVPSQIDLSGVHTRMGDYVQSELASVVDKPTITGNAITHYKRLSNGKRAVVFCVSIDHSKHLVEQFNAAGIPAAHCDGETPTAERDDKIKKFRSGEILVLSNVDLFGEGFDLPAIETAILLRPTKSLGLYLQQVGRSLRPFPGKDTAIILDHAGNCLVHGLPDEERQWSLDGRDKKSNKSESKSVKICKKCFAAQFSGTSVCPFCGFEFDKKPRVVDYVEGDLVEADPAIIRVKRLEEQKRATSMEDLIRIGKQRNYKNPYAWAKFVMDARQKKAFNRKFNRAASYLS